MKISYNLLKEFVDFEVRPSDLASILTSIGIESSVISQGCAWSGVVTAKVLGVQKHPEADKLFLCRVSDGTKEYSIVCGAKNIALGQTVPLAKIGAVLPGNLEIKKSKIRGVNSEGMICSEKELGLKEESEGIFVLDEKIEVAIPLERVLVSIDSILEIEITTNRGDCLSYLGIAREIGAKLRKAVSVPQVKVLKKLPALNCVEIKSNLCKRYIGSVISGVKVGNSPKWLIDILTKSGIKSVNNIVDITNFVMIEFGQPLHAFDLAKLSSKKIIVREAINLEKITALDGKDYKLETGMLVIADEQKPVAIAGIMGGEFSGVDDKTETIFLESAIFDASSIRKTSKKLNLSSDSSYRFERGLGWDITELAVWRAANLITEIAGGKQEALEDLHTVKYEKTKIALRFERVSKILGYTVEEDEIGEILRFLGIDLQPRGEMILCTIPSWRNDIKIEVDLIEELARIKGYDAIPTSKMNRYCPYTPSNSFLSYIVEEFRIKLRGLGFSEVLNCSFLEVSELEKFGLKYYYKIANPISKENEFLRSSLLPGLFKNLMLNISQGSETVSLFEHGKIFTEIGERKTFSAVMCGRVWHEWWKWSEQKVNPKFDFYFGGGIIKNILPSEEFMIVENLIPSSYFHIGKTAAILFRGKVIGQFGILKSLLTRSDIDIKDEVFYFEMDLETVENICVKKTTFYKAYSKFPIVKRDISVIADKSLQFVEIEKVVKAVMKSGCILKDYSLFSVYNDETKLGDGKISYSFRLSYRNDKKTLSDKEVNDDVAILLNKLDSDLDVKLRQ
ncbi:MAG: phenylalanine--tRNA ligase subunit beta [Endomicrobium sp.]|jgi:phenylalanyl-tRNA synthetase beta chain|nr:phenylalanine--tRNA ligase subunit beta [Endomicrobium sp.]